MESSRKDLAVCGKSVSFCLSERSEESLLGSDARKERFLGTQRASERQRFEFRRDLFDRCSGEHCCCDYPGVAIATDSASRRNDSVYGARATPRSQMMA